MRYVDVFISHKVEDLERARSLQRRVQSWQFTCYIDGDDTELHEVQSPRALADRIRDNLRTCRCLIFAFSTRSKRSRWMPWELGFFDGRWGSKQIGLFDLDQIASDPQGDTKPYRSEVETLSLQEYLDLYSGLTLKTLKPFIEEACSTHALSDRTDVDVDRLAALWAGALRNPFDFGVGCLQYFISLQQELWKALPPGLPGSKWPILDSGQTPVDGLLRWLEQLRHAVTTFELLPPVLIDQFSVGPIRDIAAKPFETSKGMRR
jgi:hypothetical protein